MTFKIIFLITKYFANLIYQREGKKKREGKREIERKKETECVREREKETVC